MFEQSILESSSPRATAFSVVFSTLAQSAIILFLGLLPGLYFEPLKLILAQPAVPLIAPRTRPAPVKVVSTTSKSSFPQSAAPASTTIRRITTLGASTPAQSSALADFGDPQVLFQASAITGIPATILSAGKSVPPTPPQPTPTTPPAAPPAPLRVGGNIQSAQLLHQVRPEYPALARQMRISGIVRFAATIRPDGAIAELQTLSGHPLLVQAATAAVSQWRYRPTYLNGQPVAVLTTIDVHFRLGQPLSIFSRNSCTAFPGNRMPRSCKALSELRTALPASNRISCSCSSTHSVPWYSSL